MTGPYPKLWTTAERWKLIKDTAQKVICDLSERDGLSDLAVAAAWAVGVGVVLADALEKAFSVEAYRQ